MPPVVARAARVGENRVVVHLSRDRLQAGLDKVRASPKDAGRIVLIVRRPAIGQRDMPARVVVPGVVRVGDRAEKAPAKPPTQQVPVR